MAQPTLLLVCDPADKNFELLDRALELASVNNSRLYVVDMVYANGIARVDASARTLDQAKKSLINQRTGEIKAALSARKVPAKEAKVDVFWGKDLVPYLLSLCKKLEPELVLKRVVRKSNRLFHTPTDWRLIEQCPAPLFISAAKSYKKKQRVLVAVDLTTKVKTKAKLNDQLIARANDYAKAKGAELHLVFCMAISQIISDLDVIDMHKYRNKVKRAIKPTVDRLIEDYAIDPKHIHIKSGQPDRVIDTLARKLKADITVMGTVGRRGLRGRLLGNTAEQMLQHLHTDLLLLRP